MAFSNHPDSPSHLNMLMSSDSQPDNGEPPTFVRALYNYVSQDESSLTFEQGDIIEVLTKLPSGWWDGLLGDARGWFPSNYVEELSEDELYALAGEVDPATDCNAEDDEDTQRQRFWQQHNPATSGLDAALSLAPFTYPPNGDFSAPLQLSHEYESLLAGTSQSDVFKQLAEEGMQGSIDSQNSRTTPTVTSQPLAPSAREGPGFNHAMHAVADEVARNDTIDLGGSSGIPTPSRVTSPGSQTTLGPSEREMRRQQSDLGSGTQSRPRASTALAPLHDPSRVPLRGRAASTGTSLERKAAKESDYWVPRYHDRDGIVYYNTRTGEESREIPDGHHLDYALAQPGSEDEGDDDDDDGLDIAGSRAELGRILPMQGSNYFEKLRQGGKPGLLPLRNTDSIVRRSSYPNEVRPVSLARDEEETQELQKMLAAPLGPKLDQLLHTAFERLSQLVNICAETVDLEGFSEQDRKAALHASSLLEKPGLRLTRSSSSVVKAVRELLYCVGTLNIGAADLESVSELASFMSLQETSRVSSERANALLNAATAVGASIRAREHAKTSVSAKITVSSMPASLRPMGARVSSLLSKLVLSARSITEQPVLGSRDSSNRDEERGAKLNVERLNSYRLRIREDAVELINVLDIFAGELEKQKATKSHPPWSKELEATFRSGDGAAGIGPHSLGGGAAAGWRGAGFALPSAYETAAMRLDAHGHFSDPTTVSKDARALLTSGKRSLERRPGNILSERFIVEAIKPQQEKLSELLDQLEREVRGRERTPEDSPSPPSSPSSSTLLQPIEGAAARRVTEHIRLALARFGSFIHALEDVDFASALDVEMPPSSFNDPDSADSHIASLVYSAKYGLRRFVSLKQSCYDVTSHMFMDMQDLSAVLAGHSPDVSISERIMENAGALKAMSTDLVEVSMDMTQIADEQRRARAPFIGARAKVYDLEEAMAETSSLLLPRSLQLQQRQHRGSDASSRSAQLAPSLTSSSQSPQTQRASPLRSASSSIVSPTSTTVAQSRGWLNGGGANAGIAVAARNRSMSVATGASSASSTAPHEPAGQRLRAGSDLQQPENGGNDSETEPLTAPQRASSKLRRFFGDDSPSTSSATLQQPQPSSASQAASTDTATVASSSASTATTSLVGSKKPDETPWFLQPDYDENDIVISPEGQVKGATLSALIERLTMHNSFDASFNNTLLMTYRSFTTTSQLLELLFARFRITQPPQLSPEELEVWTKQKQQPIRLRVFSVLKSWLESFFYEGEDEEHLDRICEFAFEIQSYSMELPSRQLLRLVERRRGDGEQMVRKMVLPQSAPPPILPRVTRRIKFLDIDPTEMARQLTLLESKLYNNIKPMELLGKAWSKPDADVHAKGIKNTIGTCNFITAWVTEAVLSQQDLKKRAAWIKQYIAIADACLSLNNFSTMTAILSGLNSAPVYRLKRTWDAVSQRYVIMLNNLQQLMQTSKNFHDYRALLHKLKPPCVPFLGLYLTDLTFIEDGNPDRLRADDRLINFAKRQKTADVIREIMIYQSTPYNLTPVAGIQNFIEENLVPTRGDTANYAQSLALEPREREDEKISRLLAESGFL